MAYTFTEVVSKDGHISVERGRDDVASIGIGGWQVQGFAMITVKYTEESGKPSEAYFAPWSELIFSGIEEGDVAATPPLVVARQPVDISELRR